MANDSDLFSTACIVWKTNRPFADVIRRSKSFSFLGDEWCLEAKYSDHVMKIYYTIILKKKTFKCPEGILNITTTLELHYFDVTAFDRRSNIVNHKSHWDKNYSQGIILWEFTEENLIEKFSDFLKIGTWKITCVFHNNPPLLFRNENFEVDSSTQTEVNESPTADKYVQASRNFSDWEKLSKDFSNLLSLSHYPDVNLRCSDRTFPVHKGVLALRSDFYNMFNDQKVETFIIPDLDGKTLELLLKYAYSGTIDEWSDDIAVSLYEAGRKYRMESLRKTCSGWMVEQMSKDNCVRFLEAATSSGDGVLKEAIASFLCDHPEVFNCSSWDRFAEEHQSMAYKIVHAYTLQSVKLP